jgi:hypothetical protein
MSLWIIFLLGLAIGTGVGLLAAFITLITVLVFSLAYVGVSM